MHIDKYLQFTLAAKKFVAKGKYFTRWNVVRHVNYFVQALASQLTFIYISNNRRAIEIRHVCLKGDSVKMYWARPVQFYL